MFESYGVRVILECDSRELLEDASDIATKALVGNLVFIEINGNEAIKRFSLKFVNEQFEMFENGLKTNYSDSKRLFFKYFNSMLRLTVAENAVDRVFVHAGVVGWKGKAVVIPASSFKGKTTLVAELVKLGALYYSDEYAVIDADGFVHPFPRDLSVRGIIEEYYETDVPPDRIGGKIGGEPILVGNVVLTEFAQGVTWRPDVLSIGQGILETIPHTIPLHTDAGLSLKLLKQAFKNALILKGPRGEAMETASKILDFLDKGRDSKYTI